MGWRFLGLKPFEVLQLTYKEFAIISEENIEKTHDENEQEALYSIMSAAASRGKGKKGKIPKVDELYKRPSDDDLSNSKETEEDIRAEYEYTKEWLAQFDFSKFDKENTEKE